MKKSFLAVVAIVLTTSTAQASVQDLIAEVKNKDIAAVKQLLAAGEDVNAQNAQGNTALHYAVAMDNADMTRLLIENGANLYTANEKGWTPLKIAEKKDVKNVTAVLSEMASKAETTVQAKQDKAQTIAAERQLLQRAAAAVEEARDAEKSALAAQEEAETKALILQSKVAVLEKTLMEKSKALTEAEKKAQEAEKKAQEAEKKAQEAIKKNDKVSTPVKSDKPVAKVAPKKPIPTPNKKAQLKPVPVVKVRVPQPSKFHSNMTDGADEVVYCLNLLGHGENGHMLRAAEFYAAGNGVSEAHYKEIISFVDEFYTSADDAALKTRVDTCGLIITPKNPTEQNKIIRSLNKSLGNQL